MQDTKENETIGVILLNLGGPDSMQAVKPFLYNLFSDRKIIRLGPSFMQKPLACLISTLRSGKTRRLYSLIGGKSPILDITFAQAKALEDALNQSSVVSCRSAVNNYSHSTVHCSQPFKVFVGMRYWHPLIEEVMPEIYNAGIKKLIALNLYPQYSVATSGSSMSRLTEVASEYPIEISGITSWFDHPKYINALVELIRKGAESFGHATNVHLLYSAHSLPQKFIDDGDPYVDQIKGTIQEIAKQIPFEWHLSYQSKTGPVRWLEPTTEEKLKDLARKDIKNILVVPISFVSDHIETLYEIDILYKQMAENLGINFRRVESLNTHPFFIEALKDIIIKKAKELSWAE